MTVKFTDTANAGTGFNPTPVVTAVLGGQTFLYAGAGTSNNISGFAMGADGSLTSVGAPALGPSGISSMATATVAGQPYVYVAGYAGMELGTFAVAVGGSLVQVGPAAPLPFRPNAVASVRVGTETYIYVSSDEVDAIQTSRVGAGGVLHTFSIVGGVSATALASATVGGTPYLFAAGRDIDCVNVLKIAPNGTLAPVPGTVFDTAALELDGARSLATAVVGGSTFLFVGGSDDDGISVFRVGADGSLTNVDNVTDGESADLMLDGLMSLSTGTIGGKTFLFAAGQHDDGVSVFAISAGGVLTNVGNITDGGSRELDGASGVGTAVIGGDTFLFAAGLFDHGVSAFRLSDNSGDDVYFVDSRLDIVDESGGGGTDLVSSSVSFSLADRLHVLGDVENLTLTGRANLNGTGNHLANVIIGNAGKNILNGGALKDTLKGLGGSDTYIVDSSRDAVVEARGTAAGAADLVKFTGTRGQAYLLPANVENLILTGAATTRATGNALTNILAGNSAANALDGGIGNDVLRGLGGNDRLIGGIGKDVQTGGLGNDAFVFTAANQSTRSLTDTILDFDDRGNDRIDLSRVFGPKLAFIGDDAFTKAGQVRINDVAGADVIVQVNTGGSLAADMHIRLVKTTLASMTASDFVL